jgi:hypothetical protein
VLFRSVQLNQTNLSTAHSNDPWNILTLPGFGREDPGAHIYIDDVYFARGAAARARVEIGNASTYSASTNLSLLTPSLWTANSIQATVRKGSFADGTRAYLYVIDAQGNVNAQGYPVRLGSTGASSYSRADVDQDGRISSADALLVLRRSLGMSLSATAWKEVPNNGDVDCSATVTAADALLILRKSLNMSLTGTNWCES